MSIAPNTHPMIQCTICQQEVSEEDIHPLDQTVCNTCLVYCCSDTYCMETTNLKKGHSWNTLFRFLNEPYIKEMPFCTACYDSNCHTKCKGCQVVHFYRDLTVRYGGAFGNNAPEWEQLFCKACIRLREPETTN